VPHPILSDRLPATDSTLDFTRLHQLRRQVQTGARGKAADVERTQAEVARQFEALFIAQLLKQARQTSEESGAGLFDSPQTHMVQSLGDAQLAQQLATPGIGLAQALLWQMRRAAGNVLGDAAPVAPTSRQPMSRQLASIDALIETLHQVQRKASAVISAVRDAPRHIHAFVERLSQATHLAAQDSGVPAKLILSQAALESGWGRREIRHTDGTPTHNVFGIKATPGWTGKVAHIATTEYQNGQARRVVQAFRAYDSYDAAFADYARLIRGAQRYRAVTQAATAEDAARRMQEAGYATDPAYADKLIGVMGMLR